MKNMRIKDRLAEVIFVAGNVILLSFYYLDGMALPAGRRCLEELGILPAFFR